MKPRPSFPARMEGPTTAPMHAKPATVQSNVPQGVGMDSSTVRQRMVQKLAGQGLQDPLVL